LLSGFCFRVSNFEFPISIFEFGFWPLNPESYFRRGNHP
jgi:hypothetical protein